MYCSTVPTILTLFGKTRFSLKTCPNVSPFRRRYEKCTFSYISRRCIGRRIRRNLDHLQRLVFWFCGSKQYINFYSYPNINLYESNLSLIDLTNSHIISWFIIQIIFIYLYIEYNYTSDFLRTVKLKQFLIKKFKFLL